MNIISKLKYKRSNLKNKVNKTQCKITYMHARTYTHTPHTLNSYLLTRSYENKNITGNYLLFFNGDMAHSFMLANALSPIF